MQVRWRIELFGGLRAEGDGRVITRFQTRQAGSLLAYLSFHLDRCHPRETLIELLWPGCEPAAGRDRLSSALSSLRRQLEPLSAGPLAGTVILAHRSDVRLNPAAVTTDVAEFHAALRSAVHARSHTERAQFLSRAVEQYHGRLLDGYCESWVTEEQERLTEVYFEALGQLLAYLQRSGDLDRALAYARHGVSVDPLREEAHLDLMRLYAVTGKPSAALRQYRELARLLKEEFGVNPSPETQALAREISEQPSGRGPHSIPAVTPPRRAPNASRRLPAGTVTFLLADHPDATPAGQECQDVLCRLCRCHGGHEIQAGPDSLVMAFPRAIDALAAARAWEKAVAGRSASVTGEQLRQPPTSDDRSSTDGQPEPAAGQKLRMALHTGDVAPGEAPDGGPALAPALRLLRAAHPGQILLSEAAAALLKPELEPEIPLTDLGLYRLRDGGPPERLFQICPPGAPQQFPPPAAAPAHEGYLPVPITRFFGREREIARLCEAIGCRLSAVSQTPFADSRRLTADSPRLITLTGPGGTGKTRLAVEVAHHLRVRYFGAVWFVALLELAEAGLILDKILATLRLSRSAQLDPLEQVLEALSQQPSLLVLDNFEHLVAEGAPLVQTLLERTPTLTCLVTSRRRLGLPGERELPVAPLPVPEAEGVGYRVWGVGSDQIAPASTYTLHPIPYTLLQCPSVALFLDRAQAVRPDFQITPANAAAVAGLCQRLEGLPLSLELAAARIWVLTPAQMLARLEERFELLTGRQRPADQRHRSLRAALDWSYQSLPPDVRQFFAHLSVFRGGWSLEGAEAVCEEPAALDYLEQLQECSMVLTEEAAAELPASGDEPSENACTGSLTTSSRQPMADVRFRLLETLREYGAEQLSPDERAALAERHARYYLALAERAEPGLRGPDRAEWLRHLEQAHDNLRAALDWLEASGEAEKGLRLAGSLWSFWTARGYLREGRGRLRRLLDTDGAEACSQARASALRGASVLALHHGDDQEARFLIEESLALFRGLDDQRGIAWSLGYLGFITLSVLTCGDCGGPRSLIEESLTIFRELGDPSGIATSLGYLGLVAQRQGDWAAAWTCYEESLRLFHDLGDHEGIAMMLLSLGHVARFQGNWAAARARYEESLAMQRELGDKQGIAFSLQGLGNLARVQGDDPAARTLLGESLAIYRELGLRSALALSLTNLGLVAQHQGDWAAARAHHEEGLALFRALEYQANIAESLLNLGHVARSQGDWATAQAYYAEALSIGRELGDKQGTAACLEGLADVAAQRRQPEGAA